MAMAMREVMSPSTAAISADATVGEAAGKMRDAHADFLPVLGGDGEVMGVLTGEHVARCAARAGLDLSKTFVWEVMMHALLTAHEDDPASECLCLPGGDGGGWLVVLDPSDGVAGVISPRELARYRAERWRH